jgi:hypothetical protein
MTTLTGVLARYLIAQAEAGANVVQLFDSWLGVLDRVSFGEPVAAHLQALIERVRQVVPVTDFSTGSAHLLDAIAATGPDGVSLDWRLPLGQAWELVGHQRFIQGNLDPALVRAPWPVLKEAPSRCSGRPVAGPATSSTWAPACFPNRTRTSFAVWWSSSTSGGQEWPPWMAPPSRGPRSVDRRGDSVAPHLQIGRTPR